MSKYRIIKRTFADGKELFGVQKKWMFVWWNCYHEDAHCANISNYMLDRKSGMFTHLAYAQEFIKRREGITWVKDEVVK